MAARPAPRTRLFDRSFNCRVEHFARYTRCVHGTLPHIRILTQCTPVVNLEFESKLNLKGLYQLLLIARTTALDGDSWAAATGGCWCTGITLDVEHSVHIL